MNAESHPTLLASARAFLRKSSGAAVLAVAPLAAVAIAPEAAAQTVFSAPTYSNGGYASGGSTAAVFTYTGGPYSTIDSALDSSDNGTNVVYSTLAEQSGVAGVQLAASGSFTFVRQSWDQLYFYLGRGTVSPAITDQGFTIPVTWDFNIAVTGATELTQWQAYFYVGSVYTIFTGTETGRISGTGDFVFPEWYDVSTYPADTYELLLAVSHTQTEAGDTISITMDPMTQGMAFNATAIPEPSTYALALAGGALAFAAWRRRSVRMA